MTDMQGQPVFHINGEAGWINDPNGLVLFRGEYHVFFQYYPHAAQWGPMHWGHVKSRDLTHWERLPIALYPDETEDGCFSGSAIEWQGKLWLLYTGFCENGGGENVRQRQCLASSEDGVHFVKHGVVIGEKELPPEYCPWDFRDPKVFRKNGAFYCVAAARKRDGRGRILLFRSDDLFRWEFVLDVLGRDGEGSMTECPDYRDDLGLLLYSEQFQPAAGAAHRNIHSCFARIGTLDLTRGFCGGEGEPVDYGFDFYAPQTFAGAPVMIGWLDMWDRTNPTERYGWAGQLTVPRRIEVQNGELRQTPVYTGREALRRQDVSFLSDRLKAGAVRLNAENVRSLCLLLHKKGERFVSFSLRGEEWVFDRSRAGEPIRGAERDADSLAGVRRMPCESKERVQIEIVSDNFSVEIFVGGRSLSSVVCAEADADGLELTVDADACEYIRYEIV